MIVGLHSYPTTRDGLCFHMLSHLVDIHYNVDELMLNIFKLHQYDIPMEGPRDFKPLAIVAHCAITPGKGTSNSCPRPLPNSIGHSVSLLYFLHHSHSSKYINENMAYVFSIHMYRLSLSLVVIDLFLYELCLSEICLGL